MTRLVLAVIVILCAARGEAVRGQDDTVTLASSSMLVEIDPASGNWSLLDKRSGVRWPSQGTAAIGTAPALTGAFRQADRGERSVRLLNEKGAAVTFELGDDGGSLVIRYEGKDVGDVRVLEDALTVTDAEDGYVIVPCREGLLIPANSGVAFRRTFGTSDYEGCHMNMLGLLKRGAALVVSWEDAYVFPEVRSTLPTEQQQSQRLTTTINLRRSPRSLRITPLGKGDWNTVAAGYRRIAEGKGLAVTLGEKIQRDPRAELLLGASDFKLWTCLARRMNEESTKEESVHVRWTFDEAAAIAEHLHNDLEIDRCLFMLGGWTEGGYDSRHPDNLPANPECGGNEALADAIRRIQQLDFVACLHDNYQDMYRDAKSWDTAAIEKRADGSLIQGGRWLGGRAFMVCAQKQIEYAMRPQNLPEIQKLFGPWSYFIDTTYAVGPRECADPNHPLGRNDDIDLKCRLSDEARKLFGLFGSECGREWALPHSDFFEGLVGVAGRYFHNLDPATLGATVIPFWEMVYHDCQICYGKYGYAADRSAEYVAHHVLCARPLHYHSVPDHLYWTDGATEQDTSDLVQASPRVVGVEPVDDRAFRIRYAWAVGEDLAGRATSQWRVFVHFDASGKIKFQDDHSPQPPVAQWRKGQTVEIGPHVVHVPRSFQGEAVDVYIGLFNPQNASDRVRLPDCGRDRRILVGRLVVKPQIRFVPVGDLPRPGKSCFARTDQGWAGGLHPLDAFLKTTHEVLGPLHRCTGHDRLTRLEFLTPDRAVRRATYGEGRNATAVVVNFGQSEASIQSALGGTVLLPRWGFVIESPRFAAFYAKQWNEKSYPDGALFTVQVVRGENLERATQVRLLHGFGDPEIIWRGAAHSVRRQQIID